MDGKRDSTGFLSLQKTKSHDSVSSSGSRRRGSSIGSSFGTNWFKKLSNKISGAEQDALHPQRRRSSAGSIFSSASQESDPGPSLPQNIPPTQSHVSRTQSFRDGFRRRASSAVSGNAPFGQPGAGGNGGTNEKSRSNSVTSPSPTSSPRSSPRNSRDESKNASVNPGPKQNSLTKQDGKRADSESTGSLTLSELKKRKVTTRSVGFALSTFLDNPPQRIPPVNPCEGNIEFLPNGEAIVKKRTKSFFNNDNPSHLDRNHAEIARISQAKARQNAERLHTSITTNPLASLFYSGGKGTSNASSQVYTGSAMDEDVPADHSIVGKDIDGTSHGASYSGRHDSNSPLQTDGEEENWESREVPQKLAIPTPDQIYVRCCHLREIMPIRNILRQLQGQLAPIPRVRVANTKPTLVEIQAFSDFLTVVPVSSLVLDNHIMTDEMLRLIFVGIARSRDIARITFVNTKMGPLGWQYLCSFIANSRKSMLALNLSCTDPTAVPHRVPAFDRRDMDWRLLSEALVAMGTLEELDLGGTKIKVEDLKYLVENGFKQGRILGLANNNLGHKDVQFVADWARLPDSQLMGINLSGNDLGNDEDWALVQSFLTNPRIFQLSLRNSKLSHMHASHIVKAIVPDQARKSNLRSLDLSYNPELFPHIVDRLSTALPYFPYLSRLLLEHCNLSSDAIITICEALSHCNKLVYLSVAGNGQLTESAATALCVAVHLSRSICTVEADISESNTVLRQKLAQYCIQNLEKNAGKISEQTAEDESEDETAISSFQDDLRNLAQLVQNSSPQNRPLNSSKLFSSIEDLRHRLKVRMHSLLLKRRTGPLCLKDRELLMRMFFFSANLDRLKRDAVGLHYDQEPAANAEEAVKNVGEEDVKPPLTRTSSQASINSLKKLEREEGESHKAYAEKLMDLDDDSMLDAVGKLKITDLEQIMN